MGQTLTLSRLKDVLSYDHETGLFIRKLITYRCGKVGEVAGCLCKTSGYVLISIDGRKHRAHRLAWFYVTGAWPEGEIDHKNHKRADNRWTNLREATHVENQRNQSKPKSNKSGHMGVSWSNTSHKWRSYITIDHRQFHLGFFSCKLAATMVRAAAVRDHGFHKNHGL